MEFEQQAYEVPGRELRWRVAQLKAQNLDYVVRQVGGGVYIVVVQQPPDANPFTYRPAPRRTWPRVNSSLLVRLSLCILLLALVGWGLWTAFAPSDQVTAETGGMRLDPATGHGIPDEGMWGWLPDMPALHLSWPWTDAQSQPAQPQGDGFRWPWDSAADSLAAAAASVQGTVTLAAGAVLAALVLLIVLALVRRRG